MSGSVKQCSCSRSFTAAQWLALPLRGVQKFEKHLELPTLVMRNCHCRSTICLPAPECARIDYATIDIVHGAKQVARAVAS